MTQRRFGLSEVNGALLALYFIPLWGLSVVSIVLHPVQGLFTRAHLASALYVSDTFHLVPADMLRFAWLVALAKLLVIGFFIAFLVFALRGPARRGAARELLGFALSFAGALAFLAMMMAAQVGEPSLIRLHAIEATMIVGALVVFLVEGGLPVRGQAADAAHAPA